MKTPLNPGLAVAFLCAASSGAPIPPGSGIPETLARQRSAAISSLRYQLEFRIPELRNEPIRGSATIRFELLGARDMVLDFAQPKDHVFSVSANAHPVQPRFLNGHIIVPASAMQAGDNSIEIEFTAGEDALNRGDEFLYTLFVPARAHLSFPWEIRWEPICGAT